MRNWILAGVIGVMSIFLPFWQWDGVQPLGALAMSVLAWMVIQGTEPVTNNGS